MSEVRVSRVTKRTNVLEEAYKRIEYIFDEFDNVVVGFSGGKDSTVTLEIALEVARKKNKLPLDVMFIDQEGEFQHTIDYVRRIKDRTDEVTMYWYQMPIKINVSSNSTEHYMYCWGEDYKDVWIRDKEPDSIHENTYCDEDTYFNQLFDAILKKDFKPSGGKVALLGGVRTEESPKRLKGLTKGNVYKGITWGKAPLKDVYIFYPLYDWSYTDIWKYIYDNDNDYCKIYDLMYNIGLPTVKMRVSSLFHENSVGTFHYLAELERDNWNKVVKRIYGANTYKTSEDFYRCPDNLPYMFKSWREYSEHIFDKLVADEMKPTFEKAIKKKWERYNHLVNKYNPDLHKDKEDSFWKVVINTYLKNDFCFTLLNNFIISLNMQS